MTSLQGAVFAVALGVAALAAQQTATPGGIPPLQYTCPHHADHVQDMPGTCPMQMEGAPDGICKMTLVPIRIEPEVWYTCPVHANVPNVLGRTTRHVSHRSATQGARGRHRALEVPAESR